MDISSRKNPFLRLRRTPGLLLRVAMALTSCVLSQTDANAYRRGVTSRGAVVLSAPDGHAVASLGPNAALYLLGTFKEWTEVMWLYGPEPRAIKSGWIASSAVHPEFVNEWAIHCEPEPQSSAEICIAVDDERLECKRSFVDGSYEQCRVSVDLVVRTDYAGDAHLDVEVVCFLDVRLRAENDLMWTHSRSIGYASTYLTRKSARFATVEIHPKFMSSPLRPVREVEIVSNDCRFSQLSAL